MSLSDKPGRHIVDDNCFPPLDFELHPKRVFHGSKPVAYIDDLLKLHHLVVRWLTGYGNSFGYNGYVPLMEDGTIDPTYIKLYFVGVDVFNNALLIDKNAKTLLFRGNLVKVLKKDGKIVVYIKEKSTSQLGMDDGKTDANLYLNNASQLRLTTMICPIGPDSRYYGYEPGQLIYGFVSADANNDVLTWLTVDKIRFKDNFNTKFVISLVNAKGLAIFTVESAKVKGNESNIIMGDNRYCTLEVFEFEPKDYLYAGKIRLNINLAGYIKKSSKFNIVITHYNSPFEELITTWYSPDYFYCTGLVIDTDPLDITAVIDYNSDVEKLKVYGLTYVTFGKVKFVITGINNINNGAVLPNKLKFESNITDLEYVFQLNDVNYALDLPLTIDANNVTWSHSFLIKRDLLYPLDVISAKVTLTNAYNTVVKVWLNVRIKNQMLQAYINTCDNKYETKYNVEAFDGKILPMTLTDFGLQRFANIQRLLDSEYLQVIPDYGLVWPNKFGLIDPNYNKRYYRRVFKAEDTKTDLAWGGTFVLGNMTKLLYFSHNFEIKISVNYGLTWYTLAEYKDGSNPLGVLCKVLEKDNLVAVRFALPKSLSFIKNELLYFELSMYYPNNSRITYIKYNNYDNTLEF